MKLFVSIHIIKAMLQYNLALRMCILTTSFPFNIFLDFLKLSDVLVLIDWLLTEEKPALRTSNAVDSRTPQTRL